MVRVRFCECRQTSAIEVDAIVVDEVRVLPRIHPARAEPDLPRRHIHPLHPAHHPRPLRDLLLHRAGGAIIQIEMVPPVALRHPHRFGAAVQILAKEFSRVFEEGVVARLLGDDCARRASGGVHLDHAEHLMPALVVLEGHGARVGAPDKPAHRVRVGEEHRRDDRLLPRRHIEEHRRLLIEHITGLAVEPLHILRLDLVLWARLHIVHLALEPRAHAIRGDLLGVGRPTDGSNVVGVGRSAVGRVRRPLTRTDRAHEEIEVPDRRLPLAVGGDARCIVHRCGIAIEPAAEEPSPTSAASSSTTTPTQFRTPTLGIGRRTGVAYTVDHHLEGAFIRTEGQRRKRQRHRRERATHRHPKRRRHRHMVERRPLLCRRRIGHHEAVPALHRLPIPHTRRGPDPRRRVRQIYHQVIQPLPHRLGARIVGRRPLRGEGERREEQQSGESQAIG